MTSIDAWVADWEIGCCRSVPEPGQRWGAVLVFDGDVTASGAERLERLPTGATGLAGRVQQRLPGPNGMAILRCGPIHVFLHGALEGDGFEGEGRLYEDNHFDYMDEVGFERWKVTGTVRRLWVVPGNGGDYQDWPDATGGLLQGEPKEVAAIDPRWIGPHDWEARIEIEVDDD